MSTFNDQDKILEEQIYKLNNKIRDPNKEESTYSPIFTTEVIQNSKTIKNKKSRSATTRKNIRFLIFMLTVSTRDTTGQGLVKEDQKHA